MYKGYFTDFKFTNSLINIKKVCEFSHLQNNLLSLNTMQHMPFKFHQHNVNHNPYLWPNT